MYPILCKVRYEVLHRVFRTRQLWNQVVFSIVVNWILAPLLMVRSPSRWGSFSLLYVWLTTSQLALAWAFLPDKSALREGLILVGVARCIAMVSSCSILWPCK
jgi:arsenite transporter